VGYYYPSGLEETLCKWDMYVPLITKGLRSDQWAQHSILAHIYSAASEMLQNSFPDPMMWNMEIVLSA
jgi:hypothetical protein